MHEDNDETLDAYNEMLSQKVKEKSSRLSKILKWIWVTLLFPFILFVISKCYNTYSNIEFKIDFDDVPYYFDYNLGDIVKLSIDKREIKNIYQIDCKLYNRTDKDIENFEARIELNNFTNNEPINILHKLLIYPSSQEKDWVEIEGGDEKLINEIKVKVKTLKSSWEKKEYIDVRIFLEGKQHAGITVKSPTKDVRVERYNEDRYFWFLFGWDRVIITTIAIAVLLFIMISIFVFERAVIRKQARIYRETMRNILRLCHFNNIEMNDDKIQNISSIVHIVCLNNRKYAKEISKAQQYNDIKAIVNGDIDEILGKIS